MLTIPWLRRNFLARRRLDRVFLDPPDALLRSMSGRAHWPPYSLRAFVGAPQDFEAAGRYFVEDLTALALLPPGVRVLDWGCGCGRIALPLSRSGRDILYRGVDVDHDCIAWCTSHFEESNAHFRFHHVDAPNASYNPRGAHRGVLPFADQSFDVMLATSVFTHLLPEDTERSLQEAARLLGPGGILYASAFLYGVNAQDQQRSIPFPVDRGHYALHRADFPENAVAYQEQWFRSLAERAGLALIEPVRRGVQDVMLWMKPVEEIVLGRGWYPLEQDLWRWTEPEFEVSLATPASYGAMLCFRFAIPESLANGVEIQAEAEGQALRSARFESPGEHVYRSPVPRTALSRDRALVRVQVKHLGPKAHGDPRPLGVQVVFHTLLAEHNRPVQPIQLQPA